VLEEYKEINEQKVKKKNSFIHSFIGTPVKPHDTGLVSLWYRYAYYRRVPFVPAKINSGF
jgi:hypothetical protein